jgi:hypothetical protein
MEKAIKIKMIARPRMIAEFNKLTWFSNNPDAPIVAPMIKA